MEHRRTAEWVFFPFQPIYKPECVYKKKKKKKISSYIYMPPGAVQSSAAVPLFIWKKATFVKETVCI